MNSLEVSTAGCVRAYCAADEPLQRRGVQTTQVYTTGRLDATTRNVSGLAGNDISCGTQGAPFRCADLSAPFPRVSGANLAAAYPACGAPVIGDLCLINTLVAQ